MVQSMTKVKGDRDEEKGRGVDKNLGKTQQLVPSHCLRSSGHECPTVPRQRVCSVGNCAQTPLNVSAHPIVRSGRFYQERHEEMKLRHACKISGCSEIVLRNAPNQNRQDHRMRAPW